VAFPAWTALVGLIGAIGLSWLRARLRAGAPRQPRASTRFGPADVAACLALVALALALRLPGLYARNVDNDEPVGLGVSSLEAWAESGDARLHPPLPALVMTLAAAGRADLDRARDIAAIAGVAVVALVFVVARGAGGRGAAIAAAGFTALAPAAIHASGLARGWSFVALGVLGAHALLSRALASDRERWWTAYGVVVALSAATEYAAIAPLCAEAAVVAFALRRDRRRLVGLVGAFGAALTLVAFLASVAWPTFSQGLGGGPHPADGAGKALSELAELLSGALTPFAALLALALIAVAALRHGVPLPERRLLAALATTLAVVIVVGLLTATRARYALAAVPLLALSVALAVRRLATVTSWLGFFVLGASHVALLPVFYAGSSAHMELSGGPRFARLESRLATEPGTPVAVTPEWAIAELTWRLGHVFPDASAGVDCPARLCASDGRRRYYGVEPTAAAVARLLAREPRVALFDRGSGLDPAAIFPRGPCRESEREGVTTLFLCSR
jgi:Dolichyl-phosphate-mannose-protein mannosyltransferase